MGLRLTGYRRWLAIAAAGVIGLGLCALLLDRCLESYLQSEAFRRTMSRQTSLAFKVQGEYAPIRRTGFFAVTTSGFAGDGGDRLMRAIQAQDVTATLDGWNILRNRCELQRITIVRGRVELQQFKPKPPPIRSWFARLLPTVILREVLADSADVLTQMHDQPAGIYGVKLRVRSNGKDFEYEGRNGFLRMPVFPELQVRRIHMLVTTPRLYLHEALMTPLSPESRGSLALKGDAGIGGNRRFNAQITADRMPLAPWLARSLQESIAGIVSGQLAGQGSMALQNTNSTSAALVGAGSVEIVAGRIHHLAALNRLAVLTENESLRDVRIDRCKFRFDWKYPRLEVSNFSAESKDVFRLEGKLTVHQGQLAGLFEFGVTPPYLHWLPNARQTIFSREHDGYCWTTVRMFGDLDHPKEDLTPRLKSTLAESPFAFISLVLRGIGNWFENALGRGNQESPPRPNK